MALAIDSSAINTVASGTTHNLTFNNVAGTYIVGMASYADLALNSISAMTYTAASMTELAGSSGSQVGVFTYYGKIFTRVSPATGSNTMATSYSGAFGEESETAISFTGQDGSTPITAVTAVGGSGTTGTMAFTLGAGDIAIAQIIYEQFSLTGTLDAGTSIGHVFGDPANGSNIWSAYRTTTGNITWSWSGTHPYLIVGAIVKNAAAAGLIVNPLSGRGGSAAQPLVIH